MPKRLRLTRRQPLSLSEDAYRALRRFAAEAALEPDEALTFLLEHLQSVTNEDVLNHRLRLFRAELGERKR